jgi:hypothetical protein
MRIEKNLFAKTLRATIRALIGLKRMSSAILLAIAKRSKRMGIALMLAHFMNTSNENKTNHGKKILEAFILCFAFSLLFFAIGYSTFVKYGHFNDKSDYFFHYYRAQNKCFTEFYNQSVCDSYPIGFKLISLPFGFSEPLFYAFTLFLTAFLIPLLLFHIAKSFWIIWFYFTTISFLYVINYLAIFPQAMILILFLLFFIFRKNVWVSIALIIASFFFHNSGLIFMAFAFTLYWTLRLIPFIKRRLIALPFLPPLNFTGYDWNSLMNVFSNFILIGMPLPLLIFGFMDFIKRKRKYLLILSLTLFIGIAVSPRAVLFIEILLLLGFISYFTNASKKMKVCLFLFSLLTFALNYLYWFVFFGL